MATGDLSNLNGNFKVVYADRVQDLIPDFALLQKRIEFSSAEKETGNYFAQPVLLSHESGFSYLGSTGAVASLNDAVSMTMAEAQVKGSELVLRSWLSYTALSRASKQGTKAFKRASSWLVEDMNNSTRKRVEIAMLYGQVGLGTVDVVTDLGGGSATISITEGTWAGGIWAGAEGTKLDAYTNSTKNNATGVLTITAVDSDTRTLTVSYSGTLGSEVANGDVLYFQGAYSNEMAGLAKIVQNSGQLFNINAATYSLWKGTTVSSVTALTHAKIQSALSKAVNKGLMEKVLILLSPKAFAALNVELSALRRLDGSYSKAKGENGHEALMFHSTNGDCEIVSHPFVKDGDAFIVPEDSIMRIGSVDLSFGVPGMDEQFFTLVANKNAVELQVMSDQAIFLPAPAHAVFMTGITYS